MLRVGTDDGTAVGRERGARRKRMKKYGVMEKGRRGWGVEWPCAERDCRNGRIGGSCRRRRRGTCGKERGGKRFANAGRSAVAAGWILGTGEVIDTVIDRKIDFIDAY